MAEQEVNPKAGSSTSVNIGANISDQNKQPPTPLKKTPLRDLKSENNIVAQKSSITNPVVLKEAVTSESVKVTSVKRPSPDSPMSPPHQQSSSNSGANGHLVYVRRKLESENIKNSSNEVTSRNANPSLPAQTGNKEDEIQPKSSISEPQIQTQTLSVPSEKVSVSLSLGISDTKPCSVEDKIEAAPCAVTSPVEIKVKERNWEDRYIQLQMYLKRLDQSSLEDHLQLLRSLSANELSRHAVELEKRAIQLSLEQGKELQRVKALNVLGKSVKTTTGPSGQHDPQSQC